MRASTKLARLAVCAAALSAAGCGASGSPPTAPHVNLSISAPTDGATVGVHKVTILGTVTPAGAQVDVNGRPAKVSGSSFTGTLYVASSDQKIVVSGAAHGYVGVAGQHDGHLQRERGPPDRRLGPGEHSRPHAGRSEVPSRRPHSGLRPARRSARPRAPRRSRHCTAWRLSLGWELGIGRCPRHHVGCGLEVRQLVIFVHRRRLEHVGTGQHPECAGRRRPRRRSPPPSATRGCMAAWPSGTAATSFPTARAPTTTSRASCRPAPPPMR